MKKISRFLYFCLSFLKKYLFQWSFVLVVLFFFIGIINSVHEMYPDEFDNILGGRYLLEGKVIYKDFFTHHAPVAYYVAVFPQIFSGVNFVQFRLVYAVMLGLYLLWTYRFILRRFPAEYSRIYLFVLFVLQISMTFFWGHMLLADSITALFFLPVFAYCVGTVLYERSISAWDMCVVSLLLFLGLFSSLTYTFFVAVVYLFLFARILLIKENRKLSLLGKFIGISLLPYLIIFFVFLLQGNLVEFYKQSFEFNKNYYLYNYPRPEGSTAFNPIRYVISITYTFFSNISGLLVQISAPNLQYPLQQTLAVGNVCFIVYLVLRKRIMLTVLTIGLIVFANVRSNPLSSQDNDYQIAVYLVLSLFICIVFLWRGYESFGKSNVYPGIQFITKGMFGITAFLFFFSLIFLSRQFLDKAYGKYMGMSPLIYNRPELAPIINAAVDRDDYAWIGPFAFEDLWYMEAEIPSRYHIMIPAMKNAGYVEKLTEEVREKQPKVIYFDKIFFVLGRSPESYGRPFLEYLDQEYVRYIDYRDGDLTYISVKPVTLKTDIEAKLYIRKDVVPEITERLLQEGFIRSVLRE